MSGAPPTHQKGLRQEQGFAQPHFEQAKLMDAQQSMERKTVTTPSQEKTLFLSLKDGNGAFLSSETHTITRGQGHPRGTRRRGVD